MTHGVTMAVVLGAEPDQFYISVGPLATEQLEMVSEILGSDRFRGDVEEALREQLMRRNAENN